MWNANYNLLRAYFLRDIIENVWRCSLCTNCFYKLEAFHDHKCFILHKTSPAREFGWLIPISGLLHFEMNAVRSFVKLNWQVFASVLGYELGFKSPKAQDYLHKGADHHKTWHFLEILYTSISFELITPYVKECISLGLKPSSNSYWDWCANVIDPNYVYIQHMAFSYLHALMMLRSGTLYY